MPDEPQGQDATSPPQGSAQPLAAPTQYLGTCRFCERPGVLLVLGHCWPCRSGRKRARDDMTKAAQEAAHPALLEPDAEPEPIGAEPLAED